MFLIVIFLSILFTGIFTASSETCPQPTQCLKISQCEQVKISNFLFPCGVFVNGRNVSNGYTHVCCIKKIVINVVEIVNQTRSNFSDTVLGIENVRPINYRDKNDDVNSLFPENCGPSITHRLLYGVNATFGELPWMALLGYTMPSLNILQFFCGGSLINQQYVLTAAHCIHLQGVKLTTVRLGEYYIEKNFDCTTEAGDIICADPVVDVPIEEIIIHPKYGKSAKNDIALIRLSTKVNFTDYIRPICLPFNTTLRDEDYVNKVFEIAGWGKLTGGAFMGTSFIQKGNVVGWNSTQCNAAVPPNLRPIAETQLCAASKRNQDSCKGDSGGPITIITHSDYSLSSRRYQIGIVSLGLGTTCGNRQIPSIYTKVPKYLDWIKENVRS